MASPLLFKIQNSKFKIQNSKFKIQNSKLKITSLPLLATLYFIESQILPHCIIEISDDLNELSGKLLDAVYRGASDSNIFENDDIKTRALSYSCYKVGQSTKSFIHVTVKMLSGRNIKIKKKLSDCILSKLQNMNLVNCSLTVEVADMERETYAKSGS